MFYLDHVKFKDPLRYELDLGGNWMDESQENIMLMGSSGDRMSQRIEMEMSFVRFASLFYSFLCIHSLIYSFYLLRPSKNMETFETEEN